MSGRQQEIQRIEIAQPSLGEEEWRALKDPIMQGWVTQGPKVREFEEQFARYHQVTHAIAVTSCTTGLHLALVALGIGEGDEVIVPSFTWIATANVVQYCGATPVFADVEPRTFNIDPRSIRSKLTAKTRAVIAVHLFGLCADIDAIREVLPQDVPIIEDAACASGAGYLGRPAGGLGDLAVFSFHPRKIITTGEGGMITTNDQTLAERINVLRNHGASISEEQRHAGPQPYLLPDFNVLGFNYRMTDLQGAMGIVQLAKLESLVEERRQRADFYRSELGSIDWLVLPEAPQCYAHSYQSFVCLVREDKAPRGRNELMKSLQDIGISTRPGTHAVHTLNYYRDRYGIEPGDVPGALLCHEQSMAIPLHNNMSAEDYDSIVTALKGL